jgi:hypothetical protein
MIYKAFNTLGVSPKFFQFKMKVKSTILWVITTSVDVNRRFRGTYYIKQETNNKQAANRTTWHYAPVDTAVVYTVTTMTTSNPRRLKAFSKCVVSDITYFSGLEESLLAKSV